MDTILEKYKIIQTVGRLENAFVNRYPDPSDTFQHNKLDRFLDRISQRISKSIKSKNIPVHLFLVREFSNNMNVASKLDKVYMHAHLLIFIPIEKYNDALLDMLNFSDGKDSKRFHKMRNCVSKDRQTLTTINSLQSFIEYLLKDINKDSKLYIDYHFNNCPIKDHIESLIKNKKQ